MSKQAVVGWNNYPEFIPVEVFSIHRTDVGDLFWDGSIWLEPAEYCGWCPPVEQPKMFYVVPERNL